MLRVYRSGIGWSSRIFWGSHDPSGASRSIYVLQVVFVPKKIET